MALEHRLAFVLRSEQITGGKATLTAANLSFVWGKPDGRIIGCGGEDFLW
jgi:hypothetical protein